ncbi:AAA family ATPase [Sphingomonas sp. MAH-20]|uniref:AAA family ATPase n=1 Tax=Sphingomonas horti TaxID=2682842 RepID=A0A6I4J3U2_9SPHN|nr:MULTISPECIES: TniB family NTP-binding protein [Sphingomonas]MBA2919296.1 TniB family NTP-binding protein [Sphingomonas sp. CGMCC 1.13658]MVO79329.1 AAA family ATPase [Sphingomonas horti]
MSFQQTETLDDPDFDLDSLNEAVSTLTGKPLDPATLSGPMLVAYRRLLVRAIRCPYAPQTEMDETFEEMRTAAPLLRLARLPQPAVRILAHSFTGKSVGARDYVRRVVARLGTETSSVVYVKLDSEGSVGSLAADILRALTEARPESLTPDKRWARARRSIKEHKVDLLIFDEFQRAGRRLTIHPVIAMKILDILDDGDCAIAFVGKLKAKNIFKTTEDLGNRLDTPVSIGRLRWTTHADEFMAFAHAFDQALVDSDVIRFKAGLGNPDTAQLLLEASSGFIGQFSRIIETAVVNITRAGHDGITRRDLSDAVQDWAVSNGRITYNPFEEQPDTGSGEGDDADANTEADTDDQVDTGQEVAHD